ncbi:hypothetical protein C408_2135 [Vibrio diabolicus E0666]|nr:hypothetical protein C408_2135 [Vibrio diabolicus E0666]
MILRALSTSKRLSDANRFKNSPLAVSFYVPSNELIQTIDY